jgi:hypothetical protein
MTPLNEWSARRRLHYQHYTQHTQDTNIHASAGFKHAMPGIKRQQAYAFDYTAPGIGKYRAYRYTNLLDNVP